MYNVKTISFLVTLTHTVQRPAAVMYVTIHLYREKRAHFRKPRIAKSRRVGPTMWMFMCIGSLVGCLGFNGISFTHNY